MADWEQRMRNASLDARLSPAVRGDFVAALDCIEALRKDAERYRWLRDRPQWLGWEHDFRPDEVEREIDAAMASKPAVGAA